jgi:hypothetical protein
MVFSLDGFGEATFQGCKQEYQAGQAADRNRASMSKWCDLWL